MPWALFIAIAAIWAMFLIPRWWADRADFTPRSAPPRFGPLQRQNSEAPRDWNSRRAADRPEGADAASHRETVLAARRRMVIILLAGAIVSLLGWFLLSSLWMILIHLVFDAAFVWYVMTVRRIRAFREDVNVLFTDDEVQPRTREYTAIRVVQSR